MIETELLQGVITAVIYQNYENGYTVLRMQSQDGQTVTVVGTIPLPAVGERLMVTGRWTSHPSYGKQFEAEFLERLLPETRADIMGYLSSRILKGIGPKMAARIVEHFGEKTLQIMEREPERLAEVSGISLAKAKSIGEDFLSQVGMRHLMEFFTLHHLPAELAVKTYKLYGEATVDILYDDPYLLTEEGLDAPFGVVDQFAIELGFAGNDTRRINAGILFELRYNLSAGHGFLPLDKLAAATAQLLSIEEAFALDSISRLVEAQRLVLDNLANTQIIYLPAIYEAEVFTSKKLLTLSQDTYSTPKNLNKLISGLSKTSGVDYSDQQKSAIRASATSGLLLITGGPGTGKTTIVKGIVYLYEIMGLSCVLAAPTGRAAKRLTEVTGQEASTIHRLLEAGIDPHTGEMFFAKDASNP